MHLSEILVSELERFRANSGKDKLDIVETGTIRGEGANYQANDGWSTLTFAEQVKKHGGSLISIDLDVSTADKVLRAHRMRSQVKLVQGHSLDVLAALLADAQAKDKLLFDVAFLDSDNNSDLIFNEYMQVTQIMRSPGLIIVDDVDIASREVVTGHQILPWAQANNVAHHVIKRAGDGYRTGVLVFDV